MRTNTRIAVLTIVAMTAVFGLVAGPASAGSPVSGSAWLASTLAPTDVRVMAPGPVTCPAAGRCLSVGYVVLDVPVGNNSTAPSLFPLIETLANGAWTYQILSSQLAALSPAAAALPQARLNQVACPAVDDCVAIGSYVDSANNRWALLAHLSGGVWTLSSPPVGSLVPADAQAGVTLNALSCPVVGECYAAGSYETGSGSAPLIESLNAGSWTASTAPVDQSLSAELTDVSCALSGSCVAIGDYALSQDGLADTLTGGVWSAATLPVAGLDPPAAQDPTFGHEINPQHIVCAAPGSCVVVGFYSDGSQSGQALTESLANGTWTAETAPLPYHTFVNFEAVSCPAAGSCTAVGDYGYPFAGTSVHVAAIETLATGSWTETDAPMSGLNPAASTSPYAFLHGLACPVTGSCVAVGSYSDSAGNYVGLIETMQGGSWSALTSPVSGLDPAAGGYATLGDVACSTDGRCDAIGGYAGGGNFGMAVALVDKTSTSVTCTPAAPTLTQATTCTATVTDLEPSATLTPTGTVAFSADTTTGSFSSSTCSLAPTVTGAAACSVAFTPSTATPTGAHLVTSGYGGDGLHASSTGSTSVTVTAPQPSVSPTSLTFGRVRTGKSSEQTVTLTNASSATGTLLISGIANSGASEFTIDWTASSCPNPAVTTAQLAPGRSCGIAERFAPTKTTSTKPGVFGTLTVTDNVQSSPQTVALSGK